MKYEPPWAFCAPVLDEGDLVPRVQWLLPASVQPQIDASLSKPHVMLFVHVMATGSTMRPAAHVGILIHVFDVLCNKNPVPHDVQSSALSFPQLAPAAAVPLAHVHTGDTGWMIHALVYRVVMLAFEVARFFPFHSSHP